MNGAQNITRSPLGRSEARFLAKIGARPTFTIVIARQVLGHKKNDPTPQFLVLLFIIRRDIFFSEAF